MNIVLKKARITIIIVCSLCIFLTFSAKSSGEQQQNWGLTNAGLHLIVLVVPMFLNADLDTNWGSNDNTMIFNSGLLSGDFNFTRPSAAGSEHFNNVRMSGWYWTLGRAVAYNNPGHEFKGDFALLWGKKSPTASDNSIIFEGGWSGGFNFIILKNEHNEYPYRVTCGVGTQFNILSHFTYYLRPGVDVKLGKSFTANAQIHKSIYGTKWLSEENKSISVDETRLELGASWLFGKQMKEGRNGIALRYLLTNIADADGYLKLNYSGIFASFFFPMW